MKLFRPTGHKELALVRDLNWRAWPPRLPDQPIFYPVTTYAYAEKIARDWNSIRQAPDNVGYVTAFTINAETAARYPIELAGGREHAELWVPAEELDDFNAGIVGRIQIIGFYRDKAQADLAEVPAELREGLSA